MLGETMRGRAIETPQRTRRPSGGLAALVARARQLGPWERAGAIAVELFLGIGAVFGGWSLLADAEGFGMETSWLDGTPFPDYTIPGLTLLVVVGGGMLAAAALALLGSRWAGPAALVMGTVMLGFLAVETLAVGYQGWQQVPLVALVSLGATILVAVGARSVRMPQRVT
jgi:hypothetical protein